MPHPVLIPLGIVAAVLGVGTVAVVELRKKNGVVLTPQQQAIVAQPLPPAAAAALATRGPDPDPATINSIKLGLAAGTVTLADLSKTTNGQVIVKTSPQMVGQVIPDSIATQIQKGDTLTVDVGVSGNVSAAIPSGNMAFLAEGPADMSSRTIVAHPVDNRVPDGLPPQQIPLAAITGISPGN